MKDQWIRDMRRLLDGYEKDPPDGLLDEVKQAIGERNLRPVPERKARKIPLWLVRSVAAVAVAVGIGILVFHLPVTRERPEVQTAQESSRPPYRNGHTAIQQTESDHHPGTVAGVLASVERALSPRSSQGRKVHVLRSAPSSALLAKVNVPAQISSDHLESSVSIPSSGVSGFPEKSFESFSAAICRICRRVFWEGTDKQERGWEESSGVYGFCVSACCEASSEKIGEYRPFLLWCNGRR
jgi:hypothetical protein